jgi:hypothetical protein
MIKETEKFSETANVFSEVMQLVTQEDFITFSHHESFES